MFTLRKDNEKTRLGDELSSRNYFWAPFCHFFQLYSLYGLVCECLFTNETLLPMEKGFQLGNVGISLVLLLLLRALTGTSATQASVGKDTETALDQTDDGVTERALESVTTSGYGDVTIEDDENGANVESEETPGDSDGSFNHKRHVACKLTFFLNFVCVDCLIVAVTENSSHHMTF